MKKLSFGASVAVIGLILSTFAFQNLRSGESVKLDWQTDVPKALGQARAEKKVVLLNFTGSDWCSACKVMDNEVFNQPEFAAFARTNLVLVVVDLPNRKVLPPALLAANQALTTNYDVEGFPTLIALNPDGKVVWRMDGILGDPNPQMVITPLKALPKS